LDGQNNSISDCLFERKVGDKRNEFTNYSENVLTVHQWSKTGGARRSRKFIVL